MTECTEAAQDKCEAAFEAACIAFTKDVIRMCEAFEIEVGRPIAPAELRQIAHLMHRHRMEPNAPSWALQ